MKILWLCNVMLPMIAEKLNKDATNKEGWLSGLADTVLKRREENGIELSIAFPVGKDLCPNPEEPYFCRIPVQNGVLDCYGFYEDTGHPDRYDAVMEKSLNRILKKVQPDLVHCFGTEYPHTLAMSRILPDRQRLLIGIQGLCAVYANAYFSDLPRQVIDTVTFRDGIKRDTLKAQQEKFAKRGSMEIEAVKLAGNITGRTAWDRFYTHKWHPEAAYYEMNETLRKEFYGPVWQADHCEKHAIFLSQGDYPIKGLHYMLLAMPKILQSYPDAKVYVAGNNLTAYDTWKQKLKISAYGKYLRQLIQEQHLQEHIVFVGRLDAEQMRNQYLKCGLFVCPSSIENSPNSLGEAMLLGMPCVSADVGGIESIFQGGKDGILYKGFRCRENEFNNDCDFNAEPEKQLETNAEALYRAVIEMWDKEEKMQEYCKNARNHALQTHDKEANYRKMTEIYAEIIQKRTPVIFVSNYLNHHQIPFCNAMYQALDGNFVFIQTEKMEQERLDMGWKEQSELAYLKKYYEEPEICKRLIEQAPVVLFGGSDEESYIQDRLQKKRPVIRYSERIYKTGQWKAVSPRGLKKKYQDHIRYRRQPVYMLCAGAYVASDFHLIHAYPGKLLKWGYFPETRQHDLQQLMQQKQPASILWAARLIDWKHPELPIRTAAYLKQKGYSFQLHLVGGGAMEAQVKQLIAQYQVEDVVTLHGFCDPAKVRSLMEQSEIYLATSDRQEGWGAVINEAMNSGCAVVGSSAMGAVPFLIRQGENGILYQDGKPQELFAATERLLQDRALCRKLGEAAYQTIQKEWNSETAAKRFLELCIRLGFLTPNQVKGAQAYAEAPAEGPVSKAAYKIKIEK